MGFFSSRKDESLDQDNTIGRTIRSRFFKGKEREHQAEHTLPPHPAPNPSRPPPTSFKPTTLTRAQQSDGSSSSASSIRGGTNAPRSSADVITVTLAQRLSELATANAEGLLDDEEYRLLRQNLFERFASTSAPPTETPVVKLGGSAHAPNGRSQSHPGAPSVRSRAPTRAASIQSRTSAAPTFASGVSGLLRLATGRRTASAPAQASPTDVHSMYSTVDRKPSLLQRTFPRSLSRKASEASLASTAGTPRRSDVTVASSRYPSSRHRPSEHGVLHSESESPTRGGTMKSLRRAPLGPPSAFRATTAELRPSVSAGVMDFSPAEDEERLRSAKDIRQEIELVEAEGRRLLDAFNGLELSTLTRKQPSSTTPVHTPTKSGSRRHPDHDIESGWTMVPGRTQSPTSERRSRFGGDDGMSVHSGRSGRTDVSSKSRRTPSTKARSPSTKQPAVPLPLVAQPVSLSRKTSFSSVSSRGKSAHRETLQVPYSASPLGRLRSGSTSTVNLNKSAGHLPLETVLESDAASGKTRGRGAAHPPMPPWPPGRAGDEQEEMAALEAEMSDIRRRRAEVTARYESRLEFLRAKLKGAEMHEKLLRK